MSTIEKREGAFRGYDAEGHKVVVGWINEDGTEYLIGLSKCCAAAATCSCDGQVVCKGCYRAVSPSLAAEAVLAAEGLVANVVFGEPYEELREQMDDAVAGGWARRDGDTTWFDVEGYLAVWDEDDPESAPLFVMYGDAEGVTVYAPGTDDVGELERRIHRDLAADFTIDDHGSAVAVA